MPSEKEAVELFGQFLMKHLRDRAIGFSETLVQGKWKAPALQSLQEEVRALSGEQQAVLSRCPIRAIDGAIHDFLF